MSRGHGALQRFILEHLESGRPQTVAELADTWADEMSRPEPAAWEPSLDPTYKSVYRALERLRAEGLVKRARLLDLEREYFHIGQGEWLTEPKMVVHYALTDDTWPDVEEQIFNNDRISRALGWR